MLTTTLHRPVGLGGEGGELVDGGLGGGGAGVGGAGGQGTRKPAEFRTMHAALQERGKRLARGEEQTVC